MCVPWIYLPSFPVLRPWVPSNACKYIPVTLVWKKIAKDDQFGPQGLWKKSKPPAVKKDDESDDESQGSSAANGAAANDSDEDEPRQRKEFVQSDFDPEKLRAYEASKLKYYFAVVEFAQPQQADKAYQEIDGMEFEHSSAAVDLRSIPPAELENVVKDRPLRDEAVRIPSNYVPPDFVVNALQQTTVQCSWEQGDRERELALTKYGQGLSWENMAESDDIKAYLASDVSSDEEEEDEDGNNKASKMRKMLGLDSDEDDEEGSDGDENLDVAASGSSESEEESVSGSEDEDPDQSKEITFVPGANKLEEKIRSKLDGKETSKDKDELTPWEKYQEKRRAKRIQKRQETRAKKKEVKEMRKGGSAKSQKEKPERDSFFTNDSDSEQDEKPSKMSKEELELLVAGDDDDEHKRDYDMRGLERLDKNKDKKLRGSRKRKEANRASNVTGTDFQIDTADSRFSAVLDGHDDRFGIDRMDPKFKETPAMREILAEQTTRRKKRRKKSKDEKGKSKSQKPTKDISADAALGSSKPSGGAAALSALVKSLKSNMQ